MKQNGEFKIQHGIPIPGHDSGRGRLAITHALGKMRVGDSIDVYNRAARNIYPRARYAGVTVTVRTLIDKDGNKFLRVWRRK